MWILWIYSDLSPASGRLQGQHGVVCCNCKWRDIFRGISLQNVAICGLGFLKWTLQVILSPCLYMSGEGGGNHINLNSVFQIETLSWFAMGKNQVYSFTKLLFNFGKKGEIKNKKGKIDLLKCFPEKDCIVWSCYYLQAFKPSPSSRVRNLGRCLQLLQIAEYNKYIKDRRVPFWF